MSSPKPWVAGLLVLATGLVESVQAQIPSAGAAPGGASTAVAAGLGAAGGGAASPAAAASPATATPTTLWGFLGLSKTNVHSCIAKLCGSQLGQMANSMITGPMGAISGGFIPPLSRGPIRVSDCGPSAAIAGWCCRDCREDQGK